MYQIDNQKFAAFLLQLRKEKGLTQKELAQRLYVSDKAVSKWERGLSLPDISLLQPMAEALEVSVTELLSGQRIRQDQPLTVEEVEPLLTGALNMTAQEQAQQRQRRRHWGRRLFLSLLAFALEMALLSRRIPVFSDAAVMLWLPPLMAAGFGVAFLFMREKLPEFYDKYPLNFVSDGMFRMNVPGVRFNNRNWPHIMTAMRTWSCITTAAWAPLFAILWWALEALSAPWMTVHFVTLLTGLAATLGGLFIPVYVVGKKYG